MKRIVISDRIARILGWAVTGSGLIFAALCLLLALTLGEPRLFFGAVFGLVSAGYGYEVARRDVSTPIPAIEPARLAA